MTNVDTETWAEDLVAEMAPDAFESKSIVTPNGVSMTVMRSAPDAKRPWIVRATIEAPAGSYDAVHHWVASFEHYWRPIRVTDALLSGVHQVLVEVTTTAKGEGFEEPADSLTAVNGIAARIDHILAHPPARAGSGEFRVGYDDMLLTLAEASLPCPPVPEYVIPFVARVRDWCWATEPIDFVDLYHGNLIDAPEADGRHRRRDTFFAFGAVGHGLASNFLAVEYDSRGVNHWDRVGWGNAYGAADEVAIARSWIQDLGGAIERRVLELDAATT